MLQGQQPTIFGDGKQSRDFTHVDNVVEANLIACTAPASDVAGRVFNIATGIRTDLNQVFHFVKQVTGYQGEVSYGPERAGDVKHSVADLSQAERRLNYRPIVYFEEGLRRTIEWYQTSKEV
jgi:UDP-glucose 4-epimerase